MDVIEIAVFISLVIVMGAGVAKLYEWRRDVLHGPYLKRDDPVELR